MDDNAGRGENLNIFYDIAVLLAVIFGYQKQYSKVSEAVCDKQIEGLILSMFNEASIALGKLYNVENSILTLYSMQALKKAEACDTEIAEDIKELKHNLKRTGSLISAALACRRAGMLPRRLAWGIAHAMKVMMEYSGLHALSTKKTDKKQIKKAIRETCGLDSEIELVQLIADFYSEIDQGNTSIEWINNEDHAMIAQAYQLGFMNERNIRDARSVHCRRSLMLRATWMKTLIKASTGLAAESAFAVTAYAADIPAAVCFSVTIYISTLTNSKRSLM